MNCIRSRVRQSLLVGALLASLAPLASLADDFANFRMIGIDGRVSVDYLGSKETTQSLSGTANQRVDDLRLNTQVNTHNYIYHPNFILLDIGMPKLNGYDACRRYSRIGDRYWYWRQDAG